jgi:hypothetical protein
VGDYQVCIHAYNSAMSRWRHLPRAGCPIPIFHACGASGGCRRHAFFIYFLNQAIQCK